MALEILDDWDIDDDETSAATNPETQRNPPKDFEIIPPNLLAQSIVYGKGSSDEETCLADLFKRETRLVLETVLTKINQLRRKKNMSPLGLDHIPQELPLLEELFDLLFYNIASIMCHRDYEIFSGATEEQKRNEFARFLADLNIYSVTGTVFSDFSNPLLDPFTKSLPLSLTPERFNEILKQIDLAITQDSNLLHTLENQFTHINSKNFYSASHFLGIDDDKPRIKGTERIGLPAKPGRTTHTYSRCHETALISSTLTIGRSSQMSDESDRKSAERIFQQIKLSAGITEEFLPNPFLADRGYTAMLRSLRYQFGTLKTGRNSGNVFLV